EHAQVAVQMIQLAIAKRKTGAKQGAFQAAARADSQATTVKGGTAAAAGGKLFLANRVEDYGVFQAALVFAGDADGKMWNTAQEVGRAIPRVDNPEIVRALAAAWGQAAFLAQKAVIRISLAQGIDDALFCGKVDFTDIILGIFLVDRDGIQAFDRAENQFTGAARSAQRDIQHGLHGEGHLGW